MPNWRVLTRSDPTVPGAQPPVDIVLPDQAAAQSRVAVEKAKPWVTRASIHLCPHAAGEPSGWWDCKNDPRSFYVEV